ncbi:ABC transporter transmembrane domain-containing protein [Rhizobium sp. PL01]|uniref:ABC transporter transmembrane domain-containing protein n=1 Tax=Rhizobium sp. PL01 TaxID=3085631 RepID=UPI002980CA72|nr:ABC transporter transmembrane domain-containing protein [Rhizobium sp. PL01]MDW5317500.1 ABC transporter ATP-binding protein [Rhizobium sp. PL01]
MFFSSSIPKVSGSLRKRGLFGFIWSVSGYHQIGVAFLSLLLFVLETAPLELQRRIVNIASQGGPYHGIAVLALLYAVTSLSAGLVKLVLNLYRSWIGEFATSWLRLHIFDVIKRSGSSPPRGLREGVQLSIIVAEAEPIGGFVGDSISQPLLQAGILVSVTGYLLYLQPTMTLIIALVFVPQLVFVPLLQGAINRRVATKTAVMRDVSEAIVVAGSASDVDGKQHSRIGSIFALNMDIYKIKFTMNFLMNLFVQMGHIGILAVGAYYVISGKTEVGTIVAFVSGLAKINDPWGDLVDWYRALKVTEVKFDLVRTATREEIP